MSRRGWNADRVIHKPSFGVTVEHKSLHYRRRRYSATEKFVSLVFGIETVKDDIQKETHRRLPEGIRLICPNCGEFDDASRMKYLMGTGYICPRCISQEVSHMA